MLCGDWFSQRSDSTTYIIIVTIWQELKLNIVFNWIMVMCAY